MLIFKTSGQTFESVIRNEKHAFPNCPKNWFRGETVLVSKNKADCIHSEKQISYTMSLLDIRPTTDNEIRKYWPGNDSRWKYIAICTETSHVPNPFNLDDVHNLSSTQHYKDVQIFAKIKSEDEALILPLLTPSSSNTPDEIISPEQYYEGAYQKISVNSYERNIRARRECIAHHGLSCAICRFNFGNRYGELGEGYIHVHHVVPLSKIGKEYTVDPVKDLIPLCANCHAMVHRTGTTLTVDQVRKSLKTRLRKK